MFSTSTAKRVAREAEKIVSLKEDMDAVSWTRVLEIGNQLQEGVDEAERVSLARELVSIAQSNRSLYTRLGLDPEPSSSRVMASGIEVMEGGLAEAAIEKRGDRGGRRPPIIEAPSIEPEVFVEEPSETDFQAAGVQAECDLVAKNDPDESDFIEAAEAVVRVDSPSAPLSVDPEPVDPAPVAEPAAQVEAGRTLLDAAAAGAATRAGAEAGVRGCAQREAASAAPFRAFSQPVRKSRRRSVRLRGRARPPRGR